MRSPRTPGRLVALTLVVGILIALQPGTASACSCVEVTTAQAVESADLAFVGEEIYREPIVGGRLEWATVAVTFQVVEAYKGNVASEMTIYTGSGGGDCGVGPLTGLVGIAGHLTSGRPTMDICGSLHPAGAFAAILDPVALVGIPGPPPPIDTGTSGIHPVLWIGAGAAGLALGALVLLRRRRREWQDGWNSGT